jgi:hypothetical protein
MRHVSSLDLVRSFGSYSDIALREPVIVTKNGRERLVLLSVEEFNFLRHAAGAYEDESASRGAGGKERGHSRDAQPGRPRLRSRAGKR